MVNNSNKIVQTKSIQPSHVSRFSLSGSWLGCVRCCLSGALQINDLPSSRTISHRTPPRPVCVRRRRARTSAPPSTRRTWLPWQTASGLFVHSHNWLLGGKRAGEIDRERARSVYALYAPVKLIMNAADSRQVCSRSCLHLMIRF